MTRGAAAPHAPALDGRPFRGVEDLAPMQELLRVGRRLADATTCWHPGDLEWWIASDDPAIDWSERIRLWSFAAEPDAVIAWTWWTPPDELDWFVDPRVDTLDLRAAIIDGLDRPMSTLWTCLGATDLVAWLQERGYERRGDGFIGFARGLAAADDSAVRLPDGFAIRSVALPGDMEERVRVHRAAFAPSKMTVEKHARVAAMPSYRPDLDLVVVAPDGTFASYTIAWLDAVTGTIEFEPVGSDPHFQRLGLASAVMTEAMRRAARLGAREAHVTSYAGEKGRGALGLYESLGLQRVWELVPFKRAGSA